MVVFEGVVCAMITYKTYEHVRASINTPFMSLFLRDGLIYYVIMLLAEVINLIAFTALPNSLFSIWVYPQWCMACILVSRIYLNLRNVTNSEEWSSETFAGPTTFVHQEAMEMTGVTHIYLTSKSSSSLYP